VYGDKARIEIERKFLIRDDSWRREADAGTKVRQGFLAATRGCTVRVRSVAGRGVITVKGATRGISREEYEYEIPLADAEGMLETLCSGILVEKVRYRIPRGDLVWEIDVFEGENRGLVLAEVELDREDRKVDLPPWIGEEVSRDPRYFNAYLSSRPYRSWD